MSRCFLMLVNTVALLFGVVVVYCGSSGLIATDSNVAGILASGHGFFANFSSQQVAELIAAGAKASGDVVGGLVPGASGGGGAEAAAAANRTAAPGAVNPFAVVTGAGAGATLVAAFGLCGACCAMSKDGRESARGMCFSNRVLFAYYAAVLLSAAVLLFAALVCFVFTEKTRIYSLYTKALFAALNATAVPLVGHLPVAEAQELVGRDAQTAGDFCLAAMGLDLWCATSGAAIMGFSWTARRTLVASGLLSGLFGAGLIVLAFLPSLQQYAGADGWMPKVLGGCGVFVCLMSVLGLLAALHRSQGLLVLNAACLGLLSAAMIAASVYAVRDGLAAARAAREQLLAVKTHLLDVCPGCLANRTDFGPCCADEASAMASDNLTVLGLAGCVTIVFMIANLISSVYVCRRTAEERRRALEDDDDGEELLPRGAARRGCGKRARV